MTWGNPHKTNWNIPKDAKVIRAGGEWEIYHSTSDNALYIYPTEYHAASLRLDISDLFRLLRKLNSGTAPVIAEDGAANRKRGLLS